MRRSNKACEKHQICMLFAQSIFQNNSPQRLLKPRPAHWFLQSTYCGWVSQSVCPPSVLNYLYLACSNHVGLVKFPNNVSCFREARLDHDNSFLPLMLVFIAITTCKKLIICNESNFGFAC